ncbi:MAG TPA: FMN-binding protein [Tissierellia bacterium]|nr:FMN-binding protein [Tissierellia bacterium]
MRKLIYIFLTIVLVGAIFMMGTWLVTSAQMSALEEQDFQRIDLTTVPDGVYRGEATTLLIQVEVEVAVKNGRLETIELIRHRSGKGEAAEEITEYMVAQNSVDVEAVSGASASSVVIQAAVMQALEAAVRP